jgi:RNA polymerase sigma-70 factor (ECF subfamily)
MTNQIWIQFKDELLGFIKSKINDRSLADDILQDVFIKIHSNIDSLDSQAKLSSWVYQITRNTIIDYYRKKKIVDYKDSLDFNVPEASETISKDFSKCLIPFMKTLPASDQDALNKTVFGGMTQKEYALQNGMSYSGLKSKIQRARMKLKNEFVQCCKVESDTYGNILDNDHCNC